MFSSKKKPSVVVVVAPSFKISRGTQVKSMSPIDHHQLAEAAAERRRVTRMSSTPPPVPQKPTRLRGPPLAKPPTKPVLPPKPPIKPRLFINLTSPPLSPNNIDVQLKKAPVGRAESAPSRPHRSRKSSSLSRLEGMRYARNIQQSNENIFHDDPGYCTFVSSSQELAAPLAHGKEMPVAPPRRRTRSTSGMFADTPPDEPIYAVVDFSKKINRRSLLQPTPQSAGCRPPPAALPAESVPSPESPCADATQPESDREIISKSFAAITSMFENLQHLPQGSHPTPPLRHSTSKLRHSAAAAAPLADHSPTIISRLVIGGTLIRRATVKQEDTILNSNPHQGLHEFQKVLKDVLKPKVSTNSGRIRPLRPASGSPAPSTSSCCSSSSSSSSSCSSSSSRNSSSDSCQDISSAANYDADVVSAGILGDVDTSDAAHQNSMDDEADVDIRTTAAKDRIQQIKSARPSNYNSLGRGVSLRKAVERRKSLELESSSTDTEQSAIPATTPNSGGQPADPGHFSKSRFNRIGLMRRSFVPPPDATSSPDDPASIDPASKEKPPPSLSVQDLSTGRYPTMNAHLLPDNGSASTLSLLSLPEEMEHRHGRFSSVMSLTESEAPVSRTAEAKSNKAFRIAEEIASSERVFVDCLQLICADFRAAASNDLPQVELDRILSYLPHLCNLNQNLLSDFELRLQNWASNPRISDVIVRKGPFLKLYSAYIRDYSSQMDLLSECIDRYPAFGKTLKEFEMTERCKKLSLRHYMLKPVQRMPQYRLLLDNYLSNLEPDSIDYVDTLAALKVVTEVADHANNSFKIKDKFQMLLQLQSRVSNCEIVKPGRIIIKEGELNKVSRKMLQPRYFILFNDSLIYTSYVGSPSVSSGLKLHHELPLLRMEVRLPAAANSDTDFNVISTARSFTLAASSVQVRDEWMSALNQAINEYQSNLSTFEIAQNLSPSTELHFGQQAPIWIPDSRATMCQLCTAAFTVTYRRHHCRACGKVICKSCSSNKVALEYLKFRSARVCDECYALASDFYCRIDGPGNKSELNERGAILEKEMDSSSCSSAADAGSLTPSSFVGAFSYTLGKRKDRLPGRKERKNIPERLMEVRANDTGSQMSGYLSRQIRRTWKKNWFVLKDRVLYRYKASEDVAALDAIPVLGYTIDIFRLPDGGDAEVEFHLCHTTQPPHIFQAETATIARRWVQELSLATVL